MEQKEIVIDVKNLPVWAQTIMGKHHIQKAATVYVAEEVKFGGNWHDNNIRTIYLYENGRVGSFKGSGGETMFDSPSETAAKKGFEAKLESGKMVLETNTYPKHARLWVHPSDMAKLMPEPKDAELSQAEWLALYAAKGLKANYRRAECEKYDVDYDKQIPSLKQRGLIAPNGGITTEGKNLLLSKFRPTASVWEVAEKIGLKKSTMWAFADNLMTSITKQLEREDILYFFNNQGKARGELDGKYDSEELALGIEFEKEHVDDPELAKKIARDHLEEASKWGNKKYYTELKEFERILKAGASLKEYKTEGQAAEGKEGKDDTKKQSPIKEKEKNMRQNTV